MALSNILPITVVGTVSGTTASGTPTSIFSLASVQNVTIVNEDPIPVTLNAAAAPMVSFTYGNFADVTAPGADLAGWSTNFWTAPRDGSIVGLSINLTLSVESTPGDFDCTIQARDLFGPPSNTLSATVTTTGVGEYVKTAQADPGAWPVTSGQEIGFNIAYDDFVGTLDATNALVVLQIDL